MSYFIGIRDFPFLHRQLSSSASKFLDLSSSSQDLAQDSKDVLVQRLLDLANQVTLEENLSDVSVTALHVDLDRMERLLHHSPKTPTKSKFPNIKRDDSMDTQRDHEDDIFWSSRSPSRIVNRRFQSYSTQVPQLQIEKVPDLTPRKAIDLAAEADTLLSNLSSAVKELQARKEESDHIHDILVDHAEKAAQRVMDMEEKIKDLDADFEANQSEVSYLRLQLRALELQGLQHISFDDDEELTQSIQKWKLDWADVDSRTRAKRKKLKTYVAASGGAQAVVDAS